jgi:hypothetical protein
LMSKITSLSEIISAHSGEVGRPFRMIPATDSG